MKLQVVYTLVMFSLGSALHAQTPSPPVSNSTSLPVTKIESLLMSKGTLIAKDFHPLGMLPGSIGGGSVDLDALIVTAVGRTGPALKGLRIEVKEGGRIERSNVSFLDLEELSDFLKALEYFASPESQVQPSGLVNSAGDRAHREVTFSTKGSFSITCFGQGNNRSCAVDSGIVGKSSIFIDAASLADLKTMVENAQGLLRQN